MSRCWNKFHSWPSSINRVLVIGERGTGKELIAHRLHYLSNRWQGPFISLNCAALNENLLDSELFGHEAGAFTGAQKRHLGRFERAMAAPCFWTNWQPRRCWCRKSYCG
ncbi:Phage shock protein F [Serratia fonticola]|uniref:Phage shock protein F n=1 Tax=Serratia fonticola TaxID=47917 RepID=A0A4U9WKA7_SERFO|nr:Phage shock protein F [Serratia fonticola]